MSTHDDRVESPVVEPHCAASIIVPTRDRPEDLRRCIDSVLAIPRDDIELIVADQSVGDATRAFVESLDDARVRYLHSDVAGKERAQNAAVALARGDLLLLTDDDCTVPEDWVSTYEDLFRADSEVAVVYGEVVAADHDPTTVHIPVHHTEVARRLTEPAPHEEGYGIGANMAIRRSEFEVIGRFEESLGPGSRYRSGGDWELGYRALKRGKVVLVSPAPVVVHFGARPFEGGEAQQLMKKYSYGIGAGYGLHARDGDWRAAWHAVRFAIAVVAGVLGRVLRRERPYGFRWMRVDQLLTGFATALIRGRGR